jgi:hypothetical protein
MMQRRLAVRHGFAFIARPIAVWRIHGDNYSMTAQRSGDTIEELCASLHRIMAAEPSGLFPPGYANILERRTRFALARQFLLNHSVRAEALETIGSILGGSPGERRLLGVMASLGPLSKTATLGWLTMRLRPFSLVWLIKEAIVARFFRPKVLAG